MTPFYRLVFLIFLCFCFNLARAQQSFGAVFNSLLNDQQWGAASDLVNSAGLSDAQRVFYLSLIRKARGEYDLAEQGFREILAVDPDNIEVRRQLADVLIRAEKYGQAEREMNTLLALDPREQAQTQYRAGLRNIANLRRSDVSFSVSVVQSDNVNRGTTNTTFGSSLGTLTIGADSAPRAAYGLNLGVQGYYKFIRGEDFNLRLNWGLSHTAYDDSDLDTRQARLGLSYAHTLGAYRVSMEPYLELSQDAQGQLVHAQGMDLAYGHRVNERNLLALNLGFRAQAYDDTTYLNGAERYLDFEWTHALPDKSFVELGVESEMSRPQAAHIQNDMVGVSAAYYRQFGALRAGLSLGAGTRDFVGVFPLSTQARADRYGFVGLELQHRGLKIGGSVPKLSCEQRNNTSNIALYEYEAMDCDISFTLDF